MFCTKCGQKNNEGARFCSRCGAPMINEGHSNQQTAQTPAPAQRENHIELVRAAINGDSNAFEDLYNLYKGKILALARMTVKNDADAEDMLQQAFINAWKNMSKLTSPEAFSTWLQKITLNQCYSLLRKKNIAILEDAENETDIIGNIESDEMLPAVYAERDDLRVRLGKIIDTLSDVQKQTILLYYFNEQKVEEIAYIMDCNVSAVKGRLHLARKAIRLEVEEEERKSGQKFYGIAGIPMLALGDLFVQHVTTNVLGGEIGSAVFASILEVIAADAAISVTGGAASVAGSGVASGVTGGTVATASSTAASASMTLGTKIAIAMGAVAATVGIGIGGVLLFGSNDTSKGTDITIPGAAEITSISYIHDLEYEGIPFLSISLDGKYAVIASREGSYLQIFRNNDGNYEHHKDVRMPDDIPDQVADSIIRSLTDSDIVWSNSGSKFAFSLGMDALRTARQTCILICDVEEGSIVQLTGQEINWDAGFMDRVYIRDYLATWSDDDKTIFFVRGGIGGMSGNAICSIPSNGGKVDIMHFNDDSNYIHNIFSRGNSLFYTVIHYDFSEEAGIFMYQNGRETILVENTFIVTDDSGREMSSLPTLIDVSPDGSTMLYTFLHYTSGNLGSLGIPDNSDIIGQDIYSDTFRTPLGVFVTQYGSTFILAGIRSPHQAIPLLVEPVDIDMKDTSAVSRGLVTGTLTIPINAVFSPDGRSVLFRGNDHSIYVADARDPASVQKSVFSWSADNPDTSFLTLFMHQTSSNMSVVQTKWLTNRNIVMDFNGRSILWEIVTDGSDPNWQISVSGSHSAPNPAPTPEPPMEPSPVSAPTSDPDAEEDDDSWKQNYIDLINEYRNETIYFGRNAMQMLLFINDDDIPELILSSLSAAGGSFLFTSSKYGTDSIGCGEAANFSYIERGNKFLFERSGWYRGVFTGGGHDIYGIQDGMFVVLHTGSLNINDTDQPPDEIIEWEICIWDGEDVSWDEYKIRLENAFNSSHAVYTSNTHIIQGSFTPDELIDIIKNW